MIIKMNFKQMTNDVKCRVTNVEITFCVGFCLVGLGIIRKIKLNTKKK